MPLRSWRGKALSLGMSSGTRARGCPSTTDAARHTCLMRGPPALRNSWHKGEMTCGWEQMPVTHENTMQRSTRGVGGVVVLKMVKFNTELSFFLFIYFVLTCTCDGSVLTGTWASSWALCFLLCLLLTSRDLAPLGPDNSCRFMSRKDTSVKDKDRDQRMQRLITKLLPLITQIKIFAPLHLPLKCLHNAAGSDSTAVYTRSSSCQHCQCRWSLNITA